MRVGRRGGALAVVLAVALGGACVQNEVDARGVDGKDVRPVREGLVPAEVLGLKVVPEDATGAIAGMKNTHLSELSLFSLRRAERLEATFQVARFNPEARKALNLRESMVAQVGGTRPRVVRYGADTVHLTRGTKQRIAIWFRGDYAFVLSIREDFETPRALLRAVLGIESGAPS